VTRTFAKFRPAGLLVIALAIWFVLGGCGSEKGSDTSSDGGEIVSVESLRSAVADRTTPVYWAGEQQGAELELSLDGADRTYVRYLTGGADAGDRRPDFLTVGTYAQANAVATLRQQGQKPGGVLRRAPGNATVYFDQADPGSVYLAYPGVPVEIEVYDPNFRHALQLVNSGQIVAVG
jgi:hypothetical protein